MNNIAFIFAYRRNVDKWSTPLSIVNEFNARGWNTHIVSLFDNNGQYSPNELIHFIENYEDVFIPDIVMYMDYGQFDHHLLGNHSIPSAFWVSEMGDEPQNYDKNIIKAHKFDLLLTPDYPSYLKYKQHGYNVEWWTHWADSNIHDHYFNFDYYPPVRSTRGPGGSQLMDYLSQVMPDKFINRNGLVGTDYGSFLNTGKITFQQSRWNEITRRIFEGMACGTMVLTDRLPKHTRIDDLFTEGEDIVYYDNVSEAISKINYYLWNKEERERIASNGYNKVIKQHTQANRVDSILIQYEKFKQTQSTRSTSMVV